MRSFVVFVLLAAACQQNGENNEDGNCADINQDLGKADELCIELQIQSGQTKEGQHESHRPQRDQRRRVGDPAAQDRWPPNRSRSCTICNTARAASRPW